MSISKSLTDLCSVRQNVKIIKNFADIVYNVLVVIGFCFWWIYANFELFFKILANKWSYSLLSCLQSCMYWLYICQTSCSL